MNATEIEALKKQSEIELIVVSTMEHLGSSDVTLTYSQAYHRYGSWFKENVAKGKILPCRIGNGAAPTRWFSIKSILAYQVAEMENTLKILKR